MGKKFSLSFFFLFIILSIARGGTINCKGPVINTFSDSVSVNESELPVLTLYTNHQSIKKSKSIPALLQVSSKTIPYGNVDSNLNPLQLNVAVHIRGSSSSRFPKKSFSLKLLSTDGKNDTVVSLLGLPSGSEWVLNAPYDDRSLMRNALAYNLAANMGLLSIKTVFIELILNGNYVGVYVLEQKIKCDSNSVNIPKLTLTDTIGNELTGGYILKIDRPSYGYQLWQLKTVLRVMAKKTAAIFKKNHQAGNHLKNRKNPYYQKYYLISSYPPIGASWQRTEFRYYSPSVSEISPQQIQYIKTYINQAEASLQSPNFSDPDSGYRKYFDIESFINYFIITELTKNADGYRLSTYFYKNRDSNGGKLSMGPVWDFNESMGNANICDAQNTNGWAYNFNNYCSSQPWLVPFWWQRLMQDSLFVKQLNCRWHFLRQNVLKTSTVLNNIDSMAALLSQPQKRNFNRWHILNKQTHYSPFIPYSYTNEINNLKYWLTQRLNWLDKNMPGN